MVQFKSERIRPGLYKVSVDNLKEGEYCFMASGGGAVATGPYGAMATSTNSTDIFDFGASVN
jgi:hypothetical protein